MFSLCCQDPTSDLAGSELNDDGGDEMDDEEDEEEEEEDDRQHSVASQATQIGSQGSQDWEEEEEDEEMTRRKKEEELHQTRLYQRLAFNLIWADPADTSQEIALQSSTDVNSGSGSGSSGGSSGGGGGESGESGESGGSERRLQNGFGKGHRGDDSVIYGWNAINEFLQETGCEVREEEGVEREGPF